MEGREGLESGWPIWRADHTLYYHSALVTRHFLKATGTTAGYDPAFMSGYAKSVVFPSSSTLPELVIAAFGGRRPEFAYKVYVLVSAAVIPWLVAVSGLLWRLRPAAIALAVACFLLYVWGDFPINYAAFGMLPYLLAIPLGLVATGLFCRYLERGGWAWWLASTVAMSATVLVHLTGAMIVAPAALLAYAPALLGRGEPQGAFPRSRHVGVWAMPGPVLALNAFWWLPGIWLASTKGRSDFAFAHPEGVLLRLLQIVSIESPIESALCAAGGVGLAAFARRARVPALGLIGFAGAGFFWGYLSAELRALDFLQPGRHTFAFYSALALASGLGVVEVVERVKGDGRGRLDLWAAFGMLLIALRVFGPITQHSLKARLGVERPILSSRPTARLLWIIDRVRTHVRPGERLLYEEGGFGIPGLNDPFQGGRFSGLLPERTGVEVIGGPYLHASLATNFTQFGEGKLFGLDTWGRDHFVRYARLYRPSAILCWTPQSRGFCLANPDLIEVLEDDGTFLIGRVSGFPGATIEGKATVEAEPGRLVVRDASPGVDGTLVLRYHSVPCLRASPPTSWEPVFLEDDPVPFIRLRPGTAGPVTLELRFPPESPPARAR